MRSALCAMFIPLNVYPVESIAIPLGPAMLNVRLSNRGVSISLWHISLGPGTIYMRWDEVLKMKAERNFNADEIICL